MESWIGKALIALGVFLVIIGALVLLGPKIPWLGRLPGDLRIQGERYTIYIPLATSILLSLLLTILLNLFLRR